MSAWEQAGCSVEEATGLPALPCHCSPHWALSQLSQVGACLPVAHAPAGGRGPRAPRPPPATARPTGPSLSSLRWAPACQWLTRLLSSVCLQLPPRAMDRVSIVCASSHTPLFDLLPAGAGWKEDA